MKKIGLLLSILIFVINVAALQNNIIFADSWTSQGLSIKEHSDNSLILNYSITEFQFDEIDIDNEILTNIHLPGVFLPNDEGMPNLPGSGRYLAIPQGAKAELRILDYRTERYSNLDIAPAPRIPLDTETGPLEYYKDRETYNSNVNYPENFIQLSEPSKLRGVDIVMLGITPFQYNPVTKELVVYRDIEIEVTFSGGNGYFGEDRLRNRWWDPILKDAILNSDVLPDLDFNNRETTRDGAEYVIICPDDVTFLAWADSIKAFRQKQGISTMIVTTTALGGNTVSAIETYVDNAYNNWSTPPAAILLLGDYGTGTSGINSQIYTHPAGYPDFVSDNKFADVDGDELPDIVFARITANNESQLETMITKFLDYERNPPTDTDFYDHPITALGWQTTRWFQICSETIGGFLNNELGKNPVRINAVYNGNPTTDPWSTATNTATVVNYFGPSGLGYIPATPAELGGWSGGTATDVVNAINAGSFLLQHRDHGSYTGWGEPSFTSTNIPSLTNIDNKLPFIFSINCQTGAFQNTSECFTEKFHRYTYNGQNSGALGLTAATEVSYSFVNDVFVWGSFDNMWPQYMPDYGTTPESRDVLPAFGNAAGKHFLAQSSWPYNTSNKQITYRLFHHHGDAFLRLYSEVPQNLTVNHDATLSAGLTSFSVTADNGSFIALTVNNEIIGTADGTGYPVLISIPAQNTGSVVRLTITKQNYYRYEADVNVIDPADITVNPTSFSETMEINSTQQKTISISNDGVAGSTLNYSILIAEETSSRNITGSTFTSTETEYEQDTTFDLHLSVYNASGDEEWLDGATLDFPTGVTVNSSTNFIGGSAGDLVSNGSTGNGALIVWSDNNGGYGNIYGNESATATVNISVSSEFSGDMDIDWTLSGDDWGGTPHDIGGTITLSQASAILSITSPNGGELWTAGSTHNITWNHSGAALDNVKLELSTDNGSNFIPIVSSTSNDGTYEWTVPGSASEECLVRISDPSDPTANDVSNAVFRIYEPVSWLTIDQNSGSLGQNSTDNLTLTFDTSGLSTGNYNANIEITSNDPDEPKIIVPVSLEVIPVTPSAPFNIQISVNDELKTLQWDAVTDAAIYKVYAADSPDGSFTQIGTSMTNSFDISSYNSSRKFFYVTADSELPADKTNIGKQNE